MIKKCLSLILVLIIALILPSCNKKQSKTYYFSTGEDTSIYFAQGNLQYDLATHDYIFAQSAWDVIDEIKKDEDGKAYNGCIDLFTRYNESNTSSNSNEVSCSHAIKFDMSGVNSKYLGDDWRMISAQELNYILFERENADSLFGFGKINGIYGLILLPDGWQKPKEIEFNVAKDNHMILSDNGYSNENGKNYTDNHLDEEDWSLMEAYGAVFIPASGYGKNGKLTLNNEYSCYWTSDENGEKATVLKFSSSSLKIVQITDSSYSTGYPIRLVKDNKSK